jgi:outer membrane protein assembly factor BamD (BamD/ComL family)
MFKTGGQVFARLSERFPQHNLAGKTLLLSAQCFMQATDYPAAIKGYDAVIDRDGMDKSLVAEAMYWAGHTHMESGNLEGAYHMFKKLTWDYPASTWAKFARGRLADERLENIKD